MKAPTNAVPRGWYHLGEADRLAPREIRSLHRFGRDLILWRDESGVAHLQEAHCPHLGAHIGVGGVVVGDTVQCPFHHWRFDGCGAVADIPYAKTQTVRARLDTLPVRERYGNIFGWYHPRGGEPDFDLPPAPELDGEDYIGPFRQTHLVNAHIQETVENGVDGAHFQTIHRHPGPAEYEAVRFDGTMMEVLTRQVYPSSKGPVDGTLQTLNHGCGVSVVRYRTVIEVCMLVLSTPIDIGRTEIVFQLHYRNPDHDPRIDRIGQAFKAEVNRQLTEDIPIWENKIFKPRPVLCDGDGPIMQYRRWMKQFYEDEKAA